VVIEEYGELIPGMNVDATITVSEARDTLKIPLSAVQRGNIVYVHNDDVKEEQKNTMKMPEGMKKPQSAEKEGKKTEKKGMPNMTSRFEGYTAVRVEVGLSNSDEAEIKSGLYEGQRVAYIAVQATNTNNMFGGMPMGGGMPGRR
jgi:HlyD family secretion protein